MQRRKMVLDGYTEFLDKKRIMDNPSGFDMELDELNPMLFDFQKVVVRWALKRGRAAIFADCGLGKTPMQLEWAKQVIDYTGGTILIAAPLAVSSQTVGEGSKFGIDVTPCRSQDDVNKHSINITNYEMLHKFDCSSFVGVVLDESSILKSYTGKIRNQMISGFSDCAYKLACTATPAPNDFMELGNHSEFLNIMSRVEMLSMFFTHDSSDTAKWRIKHHALSAFWKWMCSWSVLFEKPSDLGFSDDRFILPEKRTHAITITPSAAPLPGMLLHVEALSLLDRGRARKNSIKDRVQKARVIVENEPDETWLIWCGLNEESTELVKSIPGAVEVRGSQSNAVKEKHLLGFSNGDIKILVTKPSIAGFGMNWQHCHKVIFLGLSDSFEQYYQAVRRCHRFGQEHAVDVYIISAETEGAVIKNIKRKECAARDMTRGMIKNTKDIVNCNIKSAEKERAVYTMRKYESEKFTMVLGDSVECIKDIESGSIGYSIFSPPFASLYTYSNSERDMGNCDSKESFITHFTFLADELFRVMQAGRSVSIHCCNIPIMKERDGYIGLHDFRGDIIRLFQSVGFIFHSEVMIRKDPLIEATRTHSIGLAHKQLCKDSAISRQGTPDYVVTMRKHGENKNPIIHDPAGFEKYEYLGSGKPIGDVTANPLTNTMSHGIWRRYAEPVWTDIRQTRVLKRDDTVRDADKDERHICPLQTDVIGRCIQLWSNPDDVVFTPFAGIGSEVYMAVKLGRKGIGIELKESYYRQAVKNCHAASKAQAQCELNYDE